MGEGCNLGSDCDDCGPRYIAAADPLIIMPPPPSPFPPALGSTEPFPPLSPPSPPQLPPLLPPLLPPPPHGFLALSGPNAAMRLFNLITPVDEMAPNWGDEHLVNEDALYSSPLTSSMFSADDDAFRAYASNYGPASGQPSKICNAASPGLTPFDREQLCRTNAQGNWERRSPAVHPSELRSITNDVPMCETHIKFSRNSGGRSAQRNTDVLSPSSSESFTLQWSTKAAFKGSFITNAWSGAAEWAEYTATIPWSGCFTVGTDWIWETGSNNDFPQVSTLSHRIHLSLSAQGHLPPSLTPC